MTMVKAIVVKLHPEATQEGRKDTDSKYERTSGKRLKKKQEQ